MPALRLQDLLQDPDLLLTPKVVVMQVSSCLQTSAYERTGFGLTIIVTLGIIADAARKSALHGHRRPAALGGSRSLRASVPA